MQGFILLVVNFLVKDPVRARAFLIPRIELFLRRGVSAGRSSGG
jgi:hypothetical protein